MPQRTEVNIKTKTPNKTKLAHIQIYALTASQPPKERGGEREGWREKGRGWRENYLFPSSYSY
jgi:hypothetical protein